MTEFKVDDRVRHAGAANSGGRGCGTVVEVRRREAGTTRRGRKTEPEVTILVRWDGFYAITRESPHWIQHVDTD